MHPKSMVNGFLRIKTEVPMADKRGHGIRSLILEDHVSESHSFPIYAAGDERPIHFWLRIISVPVSVQFSGCAEFQGALRIIGR